jgi:hypothetical protein
VRDRGRLTFESLDFLYIPSDDVARDASWFAGVLGARKVFAIEDGGTRVAMLEMSPSPPLLLLADHLEGERPIFIYRVAALDAALTELESRGWTRESSFEIPPGPCCSFSGPGGHRIALYERTRPFVVEHFEGRSDF